MWDSAAYLVAIHGMLSSHWRLGEDVADGVAIRRLRGDGVVETVDRWRHPGARQLPLSALCVQANLLHGQALLRPRSLYKHGGGVVPRAASGGDVDPDNGAVEADLHHHGLYPFRFQLHHIGWHHTLD